MCPVECNVKPLDSSDKELGQCETLCLCGNATVELALVHSPRRQISKYGARVEWY
jgi:hypothetical protein